MTITNDNKYYRIINKLKIVSEKGLLSHHHASGIIYKGKLISSGVNVIEAGKSQHAELSAIDRFVKNYGMSLFSSKGVVKNTKLLPKNLSKLVIIVIRYHGQKLVLSKPCKHCINLLKKLGIKKIYYSNEKGQIVYDKLSSITTNHTSILQKNIKMLVKKNT